MVKKKEIKKLIRNLEQKHIKKPISLDYPKSVLKQKLELLKSMEIIKQKISGSNLPETSLAFIRTGLPNSPQEWEIYDLVEEYYFISYDYVGK